MMLNAYRVELDSMGEVNVPITAKWGAQTERSRQNFQIGDQHMPHELIQALAMLKFAAAKANQASGKLAADKAKAIQTAAQAIIAGQHADQFPLVIWQTGSGTQTNMNVNEVIAHLTPLTAEVHPNDHVNMSQSSNDVFPSAIHIAGVLAIENKLLPSLASIIARLQLLEAANHDQLKLGRTHLQDATPMRFSQEISGWRSALEHTAQQLELSLSELRQLPIGGTAVGTGLNASGAYTETVLATLSELTGTPFVADANKFHGLANKDALVFVHGALKALAGNAMKMANDIRWLASGPRAGLGEITIPANEPGSSIMPGKVNPTQCEALTMVAVQVMGNDATIGFAASQGNFELNTFMPVLAYNFVQSINLLADALTSFEQHCLIGLQPNSARMQEFVAQSLMLVTALNQHIGYEKGAQIAKAAYHEGITLKDAALRSGFVTEQQYDTWVNPADMVDN
ncbi:MAG: class II fumarate hydratase [Lactobacillaceae bacterium]|jgi:fumarate hydratase class II|nr:class II fumarate hydratase [Lactobacillaceae bacterium]